MWRSASVLTSVIGRPLPAKKRDRAVVADLPIAFIVSNLHQASHFCLSDSLSVFMAAAVLLLTVTAFTVYMYVLE